MFIYDLPLGLLLAIVELCENQDTYALALCCRDAYHALSHVLAKHQKLWRHWNTIDSDDSRRPFHERILEFTRNQNLASYVETLSFDCELEERAYSDSETMEMLSRLEKQNDKDRGDLDYIFGSSGVEAWRQAFRFNFLGCQLQWLSTYLVVMVPNLRRLECFGSTVGHDDLLFLFIKAVQTSSIIVMTRLPLQHLRVVEVKLERGCDEGGLPMEWLLASMCLPCVKTFATSRMNCCKGFMSIDEVRNSNLESLILADCTFEPDELVRVLNKIDNLKVFAYSNGQDCNVYEGGSFSPKRVTSALLLHASHSLEHLTINGRDFDEAHVVHSGFEWPYVSVAGFEKLKTLRCSTSLLTSDPTFSRSSLESMSTWETECRAATGQRYEDDDFLQPTPGTLRRLAIATRLPQSLKALHLEEYPCHTPLAYYALSEFVQKIDGLLPNLKQLYLDDWGLEYLGNKGFLDLVAEKGLKYKALHNPFQLGTGITRDYDSACAYKNDSDEDLED